MALDKATLLEPVGQEGHVRGVAPKQAGQVAHRDRPVGGVEVPESIGQRLGEVQLGQKGRCPTMHGDGKGVRLLDEFIEQ